MLAWALTLALFAGVSARSSRILGGEATTIENFPSIVQIDSRNSVTEVWQQNCAGSILTSRNIITAATCARSRSYNLLQRIRAGATYRNAGGVIYYIDNIIIHPNYISSAYSSNIAIVRLATPLTFTPAVQRTAIPPLGTVLPDNLPVTQVGWGITQTSEFSNVLNYVNVLKVNFQVCAALYLENQDWPGLEAIGDLICTGFLDVEGKGSCRGDIGGPLLYGNVTIGVIYGGEDCGNSEYPALNTDISRYTDWIVANAV